MPTLIGLDLVKLAQTHAVNQFVGSGTTMTAKFGMVVSRLLAVCTLLGCPERLYANIFSYCGEQLLGPLPGLDNDPWTAISLVSFFSFSFFSSLHCAVMCGPLACAVLSRNTPIDKLRVVTYNLGRGLSYVTLGALFGSISEAVRSVAPLFGQVLSLLAGVIIALYLVQTLTNRLVWTKSFRGPTRFVAQLLKILPEGRPLVTALVLGLLTVFLPCMTLTPILAAAATAPTMTSGAVHMAVFFAGTLPMMLIAPIVPGLVRTRVPSGVSRPLTLGFLGFVAILTIARSSAQMMHLLHP